MPELNNNVQVMLLGLGSHGIKMSWNEFVETAIMPEHVQTAHLEMLARMPAHSVAVIDLVSLGYTKRGEYYIVLAKGTDIGIAKSDIEHEAETGLRAPAPPPTGPAGLN